MNDKVSDAEVVEPGTEVKEASEGNAPAVMESSHDKLIEIALNKGADIEQLERLGLYLKLFL